MIHKTLFTITIIILFLAYQAIGNNKIESSTEKKIDTIPTSKIKEKVNMVNDEKSYILTRDRMRKYFNIKKPINWDDDIYNRQKDSIKVLESKLKYLLGIAPIFKKTAKNNWQISIQLLDEPESNYDLLDGLINWKSFNDSLPLFYTSNNLLYKYFKKENIVSTKNLTPQKLERIINAVFCNDWNFTNFISYKLPSDSNTNAYAIIGVGAQDYPFAPPNLIYVLVSKDGYTYIKEKGLRKNPLKPIPDCEKFKDSSSVIESKYRDMKIQEKQMERVIKKYCHCYMEKLRFTNQYPHLQKMIDEMYSDLQNRIK